VRKPRGAASPEARVAIETKPGEECQVYGTGPIVRDPDSGKYRRTRLFVLTLGYSRKSVRFLVFRSSARVWAEQHEKAFSTSGRFDAGRGSRQPARSRVVCRHLRSRFESLVSRCSGSLWRDSKPCRVRDPDRKGKVESGVDHAQKTPLRASASRAWKRPRRIWTTGKNVGPTKRIRGHTKRQVTAMFAEEKPSLQALPPEPFRYYQYGQRTVQLDGCVEVEAAYCGAPPGWIGR